jgi:hypothetical protein
MTSEMLATNPMAQGLHHPIFGQIGADGLLEDEGKVWRPGPVIRKIGLEPEIPLIY